MFISLEVVVPPSAIKNIITDNGVRENAARKRHLRTWERAIVKRFDI
jgi:hypothetical protein